MEAAVIINRVALTLFLVINLIVGLYPSRGIKTMRDYALGNQKIGGAILIVTLIATLMNSGYIGIKMGYTTGLVSFLSPLLLTLTALIFGWFFFPYFVQFRDTYTMAEIMGTIYGSFARKFTVLIATLFSFLVIVAQLKVLGELAEPLALPAWKLMLGFGLFISFYTCLGGVRSVAATDVLQFIAMALGFLVFGIIVLTQLDGLSSILERVDNDDRHTLFWNHPKFNTRVFYCFFWSVYPTLLISPPIIQRVLMTKRRSQIQRMFTSFSAYYFFFRVLMVLVGLALFAKQKFVNTDKINLGKLALYGSQSKIAQVCFVLALCATLMSTIDSFINALSVLWVHDIAQPMIEKNRKTTDSSNSIGWTRAVSILIGLLSTGLAVYVKSSPIDLVGYACLIISWISLPLIAGVIGFKGSSKNFIRHSIVFTGIFFVALWLTVHGYLNPLMDWMGVKYTNLKYGKIRNSKFFVFTQIAWLLSILGSGLFFFVSHYITYGKFSFQDREADLWKVRAEFTIRPNMQWLTNPRQWAQDKAGQHGAVPYLFGLFTFVSFLVPYASTEADMRVTYLLGAIRGIGIILCILLLAKDIWYKRMLPYYNLCYYVAVLYCIPFVGTLTSLSDFHGYMPILNLMLNVLLLGVLVDWRTFLLFEALGIPAAMLANKLFAGVWVPYVDHQGSLALFLSLVFALVIILVFIRKKDQLNHRQKQQINDLEQKQKRLLASYQDSERQITDGLHKNSSMMKNVQRQTDKLRALSTADLDSLQSIDESMNRFFRIAQLSKRFLILDVHTVPLQQLFDRTFALLKHNAIDPTDKNIHIDSSLMHQEITCDPYYIEIMLFNALRYLLTKDPQSSIIIKVDKSYLDYEIPQQYKTEPIPAFRMVLSTASVPPPNAIHYHPYKAQPLTIDVSNMPMLENVRIVKAHHGYLELKDDEYEITQTYVLPTNLKKINPKVNQFVSEDLAETTQLDTPEDKAFLELIKSKKLEIANVKHALKVAKYHHRLQKRNTGEPFYLHPLAVATILLEYTNDVEIIISALLHDTLEDTTYDTYQMTAMFGERVTQLVRQVTHLYSSEERPKLKLDKKGTLDALINKGDTDAMLIKLIDRLHNMRTIEGKSAEKQQIIAQETQDFFIPMAEKLKLNAVGDELKTHVHKVLNR